MRDKYRRLCNRQLLDRIYELEMNEAVLLVLTLFGWFVIFVLTIIFFYGFGGMMMFK